jgi:hypothetical protein
MKTGWVPPFSTWRETDGRRHHPKTNLINCGRTLDFSLVKFAAF